MPEPTSPPPAPDPVALLAELKRRRRNATVAALVTLAVVILLVFQTNSDTLKSYSFLVGAVPALIVYFIVGSRGLKGPKG